MTIKNNKQIIYALLHLLSFPILYLVFLLSDRVDFIPIFNNILLGLSVLIFFAYQVFFINKSTEIRANFYLKLIVTLVLIGIGLFTGYIILIVSMFSVKDGEAFSYGKEHYYILNEGWIDENFVIYKKNFLIMDKMNFEESEKTFIKIEKITNEDDKVRLNSYFYKNQDLKLYQRSDERNLEIKNSGEQDILNGFSLEDMKKIPNSNYGLIEVDRAGARSRRFFVEINNGKLNFISEVPDTSPDISGEINEDNLIFLYAKDIHGNENVYKSNDSGLNFKLLE